MQVRSIFSVSLGLVSLVLFIFAVGILVSTEPSIAQAQTAQSEDSQDQEFALEGAATCLICHNNPTVTSVLETPHGNSSIPNSPFANHDCESCHGASPDHLSSMQTPTVVFGEGAGLFPASDVETQNQVCLGCHQSGARIHWAASIHQSADLACVTCHTIHVSQSTALIERTDAGLCLTCHLEQRSQLNRRSRHPIREGLMTCSDCHNPHGSDAVSLLAKSTINDVCTTCHTEKRGPYLWEHQPVSEDCTTCHNPHGSTQARMLSVRQPFLCQGCHSEVFHPSTLYSGDDIPPVGAAQQVLGTSCTNCHSAIHGSNHPSGSRLTR